MKDPRQEKKEYLISLLKKYGEYDESIDRENISYDKVDEIFKVLLTRDKTERTKLINSYKERDLKNIKEDRKKAENLLRRTRQLSIKIKEAKDNLKDKEDLDELENKLS